MPFDCFELTLQKLVSPPRETISDKLFTRKGSCRGPSLPSGGQSVIQQLAAVLKL